MRRERVIAAVFGDSAVVATAAALAVAAVAAFAAWVSVTSLQQDFAAYWVAGMARRLGLDPYVNYVGSGTASALWDGVAPFGHSRFLYPPLIAELCRPLAALPYRAAKAIFTAAAVAAWIGSALLLPRRDRPALLVAGALCFPLYLHLERGQIDLFALPLLVLAWRCRRRAWVAGALYVGAATLKLSLLGLLPVLAGLGRWRLVGAAVGWRLAISLATVAIVGPTLANEYHTEVLPRALLYGEGGTEAMLLADSRFPPSPADDGMVALDGRSYRGSLWDRPASASLPRLLAPTSPNRRTALAPFVLAAIGLTVAARHLRRRRRELGVGADEAVADDAEALLCLAAVVACVVTSPAGWVMSFVWALPLVPLAARLRPAGRLATGPAFALGTAWIACALPAPFTGWGAVAGAALVLAAAWAALSLPPGVGA